MRWDTVIGLEIHVQLSTVTKIFSGASTLFGAKPNSQACAVDLAMPGTLPVLNSKAVDHAIMLGLAINAEIPTISVFERKNYFYPDLPKGYQTTQLERPVIGKGKIPIVLEDGTIKEIRIHHAHLEEDAGKSLHSGDFDSDLSGIDLNRAGIPLIEIVTEPDLSSATEAVIFAKKLHSLVTSLGICDGRMAEGSLRFDVNVSVRPNGTNELGTRTETKNLNSFKFMEEAILLEVDRQIDILENGGSVTQETRLYNGETKTGYSMRSKEEANDYRYFPCPDLLPVAINKSYLKKIRKKLPELPDERSTRLVAEYGIGTSEANLLAATKEISEYFETVAITSENSNQAANWTLGELMSRLNTANLPIIESPVSAEELGVLIRRICDNTISGKIAKQVLDAIWKGEGTTDVIIKERGFKQLTDTKALNKIVTSVISDNPKMVSDFINADPQRRKKKLGGLMGQIMKRSKGQADPKRANDLLSHKLHEIINGESN
tara:strand:+ start:30946 stop:32418 length:1473 start_codon:yes stop_codon:yes gene_type:complete